MTQIVVPQEAETQAAFLKHLSSEKYKLIKILENNLTKLLQAGEPTTVNTTQHLENIQEEFYAWHFLKLQNFFRFQWLDKINALNAAEDSWEWADKADGTTRVRVKLSHIFHTELQSLKVVLEKMHGTFMRDEHALFHEMFSQIAAQPSE